MFRMGIVGCGGISRVHAAAVTDCDPPVRFTACCDIRSEAAEAWAGTYGCERTYTDYREMVRDGELDGVLLATWPNQHREQIEGCLVAGAQSILCEKALTLTGPEAVDVWVMADTAGALVMEGFMFRHSPAIGELDRILSEGDAGPVDSVRAAFSCFDAEAAPVHDDARDWRQRKECGGGIPYDFACYCVNACAHFAGGLPVRVYCRTDESPAYGTVNRMHGMIEYDNGRVGIIESSKTGSFTQEVQITCANMILNLPIAWSPVPGTPIVCRTSPEWNVVETEVLDVPSANPYTLQLDNFAAAARGETSPGMPLIESVVNVFTIEALLRSGVSGEAVDVDLPKEVVEGFGDA